MNIFKISIIFSLWLPLLLVETPFVYAQNENPAPTHDVKIDVDERPSTKPSWKKQWDAARSLVENGELETAVEAYERLLDEKPNIVVALWEYCGVLVALGQWEKAGQFLETLLEYEPDNLQYLAVAGEVALHNGHYHKAISYYGQVYEDDPAGELANKAALGLAEAFQATGNTKGAFVVLEQYHQRNPKDHQVVVKLAALCRELELHEKARYYSSKLVALFPDNKNYLYLAGQAFDFSGFRDQAAKYWEKYLEFEPGSLAVHRRLADHYLKSGQYEDAVAHLKKMYKLGDLSPDLALQIAEIYYREMKRPDKALLYYEQYAVVFPDRNDISGIVNEIREQLAREYLPIVENDAAANLWRDLDLVTMNKAALFREIAALLKEKGKVGQELSLLQMLYDNNRQDLDLVFRLARLYAQEDQLDHAYNITRFLKEKKYSSNDFLLFKATVEMRSGRERECLETFSRYLHLVPLDIEVRRKLFLLTGNLGLHERLLALYEETPSSLKASKRFLEAKLDFIQALRENGLYQDAERMYDEILSTRAGMERGTLADVYFHMADTLLHRGSVFEAEQILRQVIAQGLEIETAIEKLIRLSIRQRNYSGARSWLQQRAALDGIDDIEDHEERLPPPLHFLWVELLMGEKQYDEALDLLLNHMNFSLNGDLSSEFTQRSTLYLIRVYYHLEDYDQCIALLEKVFPQRKPGSELDALGQLAARSGTLAGHSRQIAKKKIPLTASLDRAKWFKQYERNEQALWAVESMMERLPESLRGRILRIKILESLASYAEALEAVAAIPESLQQQEFFTRMKLQLQFQSGDFQEVVEKISATIDNSEQEREGEKPKEAVSDTYTFWKKVLLARALWAENKREEAIAVYDSLVDVPVDTLFLKKVEVEKINFHLPPLKKSFWNIVPFGTSSRRPSIASVMEPQFVTQNVGKPVDEIAASLYGKYRWQKLVEKELSARQAVEKREYYHAQKEYLSLLEEEESQESLFDLANIYSKLGLHGKAAELYELMKEKGPLYPGLDEYAEVNNLKRQPRVSVSMLSESHKGRDGYRNLRKRSFGIGGWLMPSYDQEVSLRMFLNRYQPRQSQEEKRSRSMIATYSTYFKNTTDVNISLGANAPTNSGATGDTTEFLYKVECFRRVNKALEMYARFEQDLVEDSYRSVNDSIIHRDFETGLKYDVFPRWFVGGDYRYRMYSDDNRQIRYKVWSQYHLFGEVNQFNIKYSYENIRNTDANVGRDNVFSNVFAEGDSVYWSPSRYWQHLFTMSFRHYFDTSWKRVNPISYCSAGYSIGYEKDNQVSHEFDLNIFLEITRHFLLKGTFTSENGEDHDETQAAFSIIYRW